MRRIRVRDKGVKLHVVRILDVSRCYLDVRGILCGAWSKCLIHLKMAENAPGLYIFTRVSGKPEVSGFSPPTTTALAPSL